MRLIMECDGGSRGNPGPAGTGSTVKNTDGDELGCVWEYIDHATNNVAEYRGLINGLNLAVEIATGHGSNPAELTVDVRMDSRLVVEQMSGRWKIKHPDMKPLAQKAQHIVATLGDVSFTWVPRNENKRADELANRAMDDRAGGRCIDNEKTSQAAQPAPWYGEQRPTRFLLLRHGQTSLNKEGKFSGRGNTALTELGREQADRAAQYIGGRGGIDLVFCSPLQRCLDSAAASARALGLDPDRDIHTDDDLIEMDFGRWEAQTFDDVRQQWPDEHRQCFNDSASAPHGGESQDDVYRRTGQSLERIAAQHPGKTILIVSHMTPIKSIIRRALGMTGAIYRTLHLDVASLSIVEFFPDGAGVVRLVNDTHYLH